MTPEQGTEETEAGQAWSWKTGSHEKRARMEKYLEWLLTPKAERDPSTKRELAERLEVTPQTLRNYQRDPWLQRELIQRGRAIARVERAQDVLDTLYDIAVDRENPRAVQAAKTWLQWVNTRVEPALDTDIAEMDEEEFKAFLAENLDVLLD